MSGVIVNAATLFSLKWLVLSFVNSHFIHMNRYFSLWILILCESAFLFCFSPPSSVVQAIKCVWRSDCEAELRQWQQLARWTVCSSSSPPLWVGWSTWHKPRCHRTKYSPQTLRLIKGILMNNVFIYINVYAFIYKYNFYTGYAHIHVYPHTVTDIYVNACTHACMHTCICNQ